MGNVSPQIASAETGAANSAAISTKASPDTNNPTTNPAPRTFDMVIEGLIKKMGSAWTEKTADQHRLGIRLLRHVVGSDDASRIEKRHIGEYVDVLGQLQLLQLPQVIA